MATLEKTLAAMRQEHYELGIAIQVFERRNGKQPKVNALEQALEMASENGNKPKRGKKNKRRTGAGMGNHVKPLPEVEPIKGLDLSGAKNLTEAIPKALAAINEPVDARSLTAYIRHAGLKVDARGVSSCASMMVRKRLGHVKRSSKSGLISLSA